MVSIRLSVRFAEGSIREPLVIRLDAANFNRTVTVAPMGETEIDVPASVIYVTAESARHWSGTRAFLISEPQQQIAFDVYPAGVVRATLPEGVKGPARMQFQSASAAENTLAGSNSCTLDETVLICLLPAGRHDLRLRIPGYSSVYFWEQVVSAGKTLDVGKLTLRPGASLVGRVRVSDLPKGSAEKVMVRLSTPGNPHEAQRQALRESVSRVNTRGIFHFDGLTPERYEVTVALPGFTHGRVAVDVVEGRESELAQPIVLQRPARLMVEIAPALDPVGKRWNLNLSPVDPDRGLLDTVHEGAAAADGTWSWRGNPGNYEVRVSTSDGAMVDVRSLALDPADTDARITVNFQAVRGVVTLGDQPLKKAKLIFGGMFGGVRVPVVTDEEGCFVTTIPAREGKYPVTVTSDEPALRRSVEVECSDIDVEIRLPDRRLVGTIVDEAGDPVENAIVNIVALDQPDESRIQVRGKSGGLFFAHALPGKRFNVDVEAPTGSSDPVEVRFEGEVEKRVEIVVRPQQRVRGQVMTSYGPQAGATVWAIPLQPVRSIRNAVSRADGTFAVSVPPATREVDLVVSLPGFAHRLLRIPHRADAAFNVIVGPEAGTLVLDAPAHAVDVPGPELAFLVHNGARVPLYFLKKWGMRGEQNGVVRLTVPQMEPGAYRVCVLPAQARAHGIPLDESRCVSGVLSPFGELHLTAN